jgi:hypothetical protein
VESAHTYVLLAIRSFKGSAEKTHACVIGISLYELLPTYVTTCTCIVQAQSNIGACSVQHILSRGTAHIHLVSELPTCSAQCQAPAEEQRLLRRTTGKPVSGLTKVSMPCIHSLPATSLSGIVSRTPLRAHGRSDRRRFCGLSATATPDIANGADVDIVAPKKVSMVSLGCPKNTVDGERFISICNREFLQ